MFFRTDLAVERREIFKRANKINSEIDEYNRLRRPELYKDL